MIAAPPGREVVFGRGAAGTRGQPLLADRLDARGLGFAHLDALLVQVGAPELVTELDLSSNGLVAPHGLRRFARLRSLDLRHNRLSEVGELLAELAHLRGLEHLDLRHNPLLGGQLGVGEPALVTRHALIRALPALRSLDGVTVTDNERAISALAQHPGAPPGLPDSPGLVRVAWAQMGDSSGHGQRAPSAAPPAAYLTPPRFAAALGVGRESADGAVGSVAYRVPSGMLSVGADGRSRAEFAETLRVEAERALSRAQQARVGSRASVAGSQFAAAWEATGSCLGSSPEGRVALELGGSRPGQAGSSKLDQSGALGQSGMSRLDKSGSSGLDQSGAWHESGPLSLGDIEVARHEQARAALESQSAEPQWLWEIG
ncbi:hypothetical protein T492DRAFT_888801 [Pavlovales sp. CCMP2436]|nr:hypothetical protein T492DRAFT_888801 [Pavlovales sp. CCMP2436]